MKRLSYWTTDYFLILSLKYVLLRQKEFLVVRIFHRKSGEQ